LYLTFLLTLSLEFEPCQTNINWHTMLHSSSANGP